MEIYLRPIKAAKNLLKQIHDLIVYYGQLPHMLTLNQPAPDFHLADQNGTMRRLTDYKGKWLVLYFYPKDDTPGCTTEACEFRDNFLIFKKLGITVLGVSIDKVASHKKFEEKFALPFTLLADPERKIVKAYQVWGPKEYMGREYMGTIRTSFLINPEGKVAKIYERVRPKTHADEVLRDCRKIAQPGRRTAH